MPPISPYIYNMNFTQAIIAVLGGVTIFLATLENRMLKRIGYIIGILCQPLWIVETSSAHQWGMLALSIAYFVIYCRALIVNNGKHQQPAPNTYEGNMPCNQSVPKTRFP